MTTTNSIISYETQGNRYVVFWLITILFAIIYSNTLNNEWHFDDVPNITKAEHIQISRLTLDEFKQSTISEERNRLYRPVARITLALNWYFGKKDTTGYHLVNISIHILTCFFLYLTLMELLQTQYIPRIMYGNRQFIALLAAVLWAINPIQTQAVTYIIQRMASLAALFYIIGMFFYFKFRLCPIKTGKFFFLVLAVLAYVLSFGSKENGVMLPFSILLAEACFFHTIDFKKISRKWAIVFLSVFFSVLVIGIYLFSVLQYEPVTYFANLAEQYGKRPFTLEERILTQPRIILFYLSQIFYPVATRLSIAHDVTLSTSLLTPWSTIAAIVIIGALLVFAFISMSKYRILSFAILFYFLNHLIESTIFPLELVFEHRNYLPSMFLFLPVAGLIHFGIDFFERQGKRTTKNLIIGFTTLLLFLLGTGSYVRNMAWYTEESLWQDALEKAPGKGRPYNNYAVSIIERDPEEATSLLQQAVDKNSNKIHANELISYINLVYIYSNKGDYKKAIDYSLKILELKPDHVQARMDLINSYLNTGNLKTALLHADLIVKNRPENVDALILQGFILLKMRAYEKAYPGIKKAVGLAPDKKKSLLNMGHVALNLGKYEKAEHYLKRVLAHYPNSITAHFLLIWNHLMSEDPTKAKQQADQLISTFSLTFMEEYIQSLGTEPNMTWPVDINVVLPFIKKQLQNRVETMTNKTGSYSDLDL